MSRKNLKRTVITFLTVILVICLVTGSNVTKTAAYFNDIEDATTNGIQGWIASLWTQTSQADFEAGVSSQVDTTTSPGDVNLLETPNWYNHDWNYRKKISIDHTKVDDNLTDFPVLISLSSDPDLAARAQSNGDDLLFTSSNGTTKLSHEIESFSNGTGELVAWVKVPSLSSATDTDIYMYYGNSTCGNQENTTGVWDSNFKMVQHLNDAPASSGGTVYFNDFETEVGFDYGNLNPTMTTEAKKNGEYGIRGDGNKSYLRACRQENSGRNVVFEAWVCPRYSDVTSLAAICFGQQTTNELYGYQCLIDQRSGGIMQIRKNYNSSSPLAQSSVPTILEDTWYWFKVTWEDDGQITFELYDAGGGLIDTISANDNTYVDGYYGVAAYQNADWDDFRMESMGTAAGTGTDDSTSNSNDGVKVGVNEPIETEGMIGKGQDFDGSNDYINCGDSASLQVDYITVEGWAKFDVNTGNRVIASIDDGTNRRWALYLLDGGPYMLRFFVFVNNLWKSPDYVWQPTPDTWYYIVGVKGTDYVRTYINGVEVGTAQYLPGVMDKDPMNLRIGVGNYPGYFDGIIDEVRISNVERSAEWLKACYNNQSSPDNFYSVGNEIGIYVSLGTLASQVLDTGASATTWNMLFWDETLMSNTDITFEVRASDTLFGASDATPSWTSVGGTSPVISGLPLGRYLQWRVTLTTSDTSNTPTLHEVRVYHY
jgi:hypothetical protein